MSRESRSIDLDGDGNQQKKQREPQFYNAHIRCNNCSHAGEARIPKGLTVDQYPCPHCHCVRLCRTNAQKQPRNRGKGKTL